MINESFEEAKQNFTKFLIGQNLPEDIVWLFREDIIRQEKRILINGRFSVSENEKIARKLYEEGKMKNFGISPDAFCIWGLRIGCTIRLPEDELNAQYKLMSSEHLKISCLNNLYEADIVKNALAWKIFKFLRFADPPHIKEQKDSLPSKKHLQFR